MSNFSMATTAQTASHSSQTATMPLQKGKSSVFAGGLCTRQICFILCAYTASTKLLLYPTALAYECGNSLWLPALISFLLGGVAVWAAAYACSKVQKPFYEVLAERFGQPFAKVIFCLLAFFFLAATVIPMGEQKLYVQNVFYDTLPSLMAFVPFFLFSVYAGSKSFHNAGRCADILFFVFLTAYVSILAMSLGECRFSALLPFLKTPFSSLVKGSAVSSYHFPEAAYLLLFMGNFQYRKGDAARITLSYVGGGVAVLFFLVVFCGVYSFLMPNRLFAIAQVAQYFPAISVVGRVDLIILYALNLVTLFAIVLNIQACSACLSAVFPRGNSRLWSVILNVILLALTVGFDHHFILVQTFYAQWMWILFLLFGVLLPCLSPLLVGGKGKGGSAPLRKNCNHSLTWQTVSASSKTQKGANHEV
jgi:hypothetical protein